MSLFDLVSFVSTEDFADAHEPLNDGVKKVPNAQTVAAGVKSTGGADTTNSGPAKVIPAKKDTDDESKTEHTTVKESAEKGNSGAKPAAPAAKTEPAKTDKDSGSDTPSKPNPAKSEKPDGEDKEGSDKKPFPPVAKDDKSDDDKADKEPLAHDTEEKTKDELKKTETATTALEAYLPKARRFDIIGHPKVQAERISKMVAFIHRRAGGQAPATLSMESISNAVTIGRDRMAKLEGDLRHFESIRVSNEDIGDSMGIDNPPIEAAVTEVPTETGGDLLSPEAAGGLTALETDPLDVPILEIERVQETIDVLTQGGAAIEQYIKIIRSTPKMSKQAAAVLHAGLEHIDRTCELKIRTTGMESYLTTPRAAMEEAEVKEKSLLDRAGEIGAKILKWLAEMVEKAGNLWERFANGLTGIKSDVEDVKKKIDTTRRLGAGAPLVLKTPVTEWFIGDEFIGDHVSKEEWAGIDGLHDGIVSLQRDLVKPALATLKRDGISEATVDALKSIESSANSHHVREFELPGGLQVAQQGATFNIGLGKKGATMQEQYEYTIPSDSTIRKNVDDILKFVDRLGDDNVLNTLRKVKDDVTRELTAARKKGEFDEAVFQQVQAELMVSTVQPFSITSYFRIANHLARGVRLKVVFYGHLLKDNTGDVPPEQ